MSKGVNIKPTSVIMARLGIEPNGRVQKFFTNSCYRYMDKYVPMDTGDLRTIVDIGNNYIKYEVPYAKIQYYGIINGKPIQHYTTAGTGAYWDKRMVSAEMTSVMNEVRNYINRGI